MTLPSMKILASARYTNVDRPYGYLFVKMVIAIAFQAKSYLISSAQQILLRVDNEVTKEQFEKNDEHWTGQSANQATSA